MKWHKINESFLYGKIEQEVEWATSSKGFEYGWLCFRQAMAKVLRRKVPGIRQEMEECLHEFRRRIYNNACRDMELIEQVQKKVIIPFGKSCSALALNYGEEEEMDMFESAFNDIAAFEDLLNDGTIEDLTQKVKDFINWHYNESTLTAESIEDDPTNVCPYCGADGVDTENPHLRYFNDGDQFNVECHCGKCDNYWTVKFQINQVKLIKPPEFNVSNPNRII